MVKAAYKRTDSGTNDERLDAGPEARDDSVSRNIDTVAQIHARSELKVHPTQRAIEVAAAWLGRPEFLIAVGFGIICWILLNDYARQVGLKPWDPAPFNCLQAVVGIFGSLLAIIILITQNRQGKAAERRAQLELHVNMLTEQKVAKLIQLLEELRVDMPNVRNRVDSEADQMQEPVDHHEVLSALEQRFETADPTDHSRDLPGPAGNLHNNSSSSNSGTCHLSDGEQAVN